MKRFLDFNSDSFKGIYGGKVPDTEEELYMRCLRYANEVLDPSLTLDEAKMLAISQFSNVRNKGKPALRSCFAEPEEAFSIIFKVTYEFSTGALNALFTNRVFAFAFKRFFESDDGKAFAKARFTE